MTVKNILRAVAVFTLCGLLPIAIMAQQTLPYTTSFESPSFSTGDLNGQNGWTVNDGTSEVTNARAQDGSQSVRLDANSQIDKAFDSGSYTQVWVEGYFQGQGTSGTPTFPTSPEASAIVAFTDTANQGVQAYNGTSANFEAAANTNVSDSTWTQVTILLDFTPKTWDLWVDGVLKLSDLGFRDAGVAKFNGFTGFSSTESYLDYFRAIPFVKGDGNLDANVNVADVITLINIVDGGGVESDIIKFEHLDMDNNDALESADVPLLSNAILGK